MLWMVINDFSKREITANANVQFMDQSIVIYVLKGKFIYFKNFINTIHNKKSDIPKYSLILKTSGIPKSLETAKILSLSKV